ncbi:MAG: VOC family protein [Fimbriimonadaceae bacterium]|nr:VOC family protein [Fimbriimonadaceae bacterium]
MGKLRTFLWFNGDAEAAVAHYQTIFPDLVIAETLRYGPGMMMPEGSVLTINFTLFGQAFVAMNSPKDHAFTPSVSILVECETQAEIDHYWDGLLDGGTSMACGWLTDKFGVTWQITPRLLLDWIHDPDADRQQRVFSAMVNMIKLDLPALQRAYDGS